MSKVWNVFSSDFGDNDNAGKPDDEGTHVSCYRTIRYGCGKCGSILKRIKDGDIPLVFCDTTSCVRFRMEFIEPKNEGFQNRAYLEVYEKEKGGENHERG
jgi:hypothetical protein